MNKPITDQESTLELLNHLHETPHVSQRSLSKKLSISLGKVNFLIRELSKKGWLKVKKATKSENKLRYIYVLTPKGISQRGKLTKKFLERKIEEYDRLKQEIEQLKNQV